MTTHPILSKLLTHTTPGRPVVQVDKNAKQNGADTFNHLDRTTLVKLDQKNLVNIRSLTGRGKCSHAHCVRG